MISSNLCDYSDANKHVKTTATIPNAAAGAAPINNTNIKNIFKNCVFQLQIV